jgi:ketosteroid isomerase-like protein
MRIPAIAVAAALLSVACASEPNLDTERAAIMHADSAWLAAAASRNVDSTLDFWTDDARLISPGEPPVVGRDAIRKMLTDAFTLPDFTVSWHTDEVIVGPGGNMAYSFGTNQFTMPNASGGVDTLRGQAVVVWRKGDDGRWRSAVDSWTPSPAPAPVPRPE